MTVENILALTELILALLVAGHALLYKRDTRSAIFWVLLILLVPWLGMILYALFGINRIRVLAARYTTGKNRFRIVLSVPNVSEPLLLEGINAEHQSLYSVELLENGDQCFPAMLAHMDQAQHEILLSSYIFDNDSIGQKFAASLQCAARRGVNVYVLIDGVGKLYSFPTIGKLLEKSETVNYATFLPTLAPWSLRFLNLRNHRKLLIIDRKQAFMGGMNIRQGHVLALQTKSPVKDVHFLLKGPVIEDLVAIFSSDWRFATKGEEIKPANIVTSTNLNQHKPIKCRILSDGPNLNYSKLGLTLLVRISEAKKQLRIVTPYFLPDRILIMALATAALRGVEVSVLLPRKNNLPWVKWAMAAQAWQLLEYGIKIYESPGEFDHSKIFTSDSQYAIVGSSNWDARSLRLNFEINIEIHDDAFARRLNDHIDERLAESREIDFAAVNSRHLTTRLRDSAARLFLPIL